MGDFDLVIRGGSVCAGDGSEPIQADVGITHGRIMAVGSVSGQGRDEFDASGKLVTPGFVDIHTHYDGQVTWEQTLRPSSGHGVTTAVFGNCGVGFAPCRPSERGLLIKVMEGVEDIPEIVMTQGIPWTWETYPEYLDWLSSRAYDIDFGALVPHAPVRVYVMGERGASREPANGEDLAAMAEIVRKAVEAGALGFSTSRSQLHRRKDGALAPTVTSGEEELKAIANGMGRGYIQLLDDFNDLSAEGATDLDMLRRVTSSSGRPIMFPVLEYPWQPDLWRRLLQGVQTANDEGLELWATLFPRGVGLLLSIHSSANPFSLNPSYQPLIDLPFEKKVAALRDPDLRRRLLMEEPLPGKLPPTALMMVRNFDAMFKLDSPANYVPNEKTRIRDIAKARGVSLEQAAYDALLEYDGGQVLCSPGANLSDPSLDAVREMLCAPNTLVALGDGGAHYGMICDSTYPTFMLTYWARDRKEGPALSIGKVVQLLTSIPSQAIGLRDRGIIAPGMRADINVIDYEHLELGLPYSVNDLPSGGRRFHQDACGYVATYVNGTAIVMNGEPTDAKPGRLIRRGEGVHAEVTG